MVSGCGGHPGMKRSTGSSDPQPLCTSGLSTNGPPLMAHAPTAMTSFGAGTAAYVSKSAVSHVFADRPGDDNAVGMSR